MRITYTADDGSVFDSEDECKEYEDEQIRPCLAILELMTFYDEKGKRLRKAYDDPTQQLEYCYQNGYFVTLARDLTQEEIHYIDEIGIPNLPTTKDTYRWDDAEERWFSYFEEWEQFLKRWEPIDTLLP